MMTKRHLCFLIIGLLTLMAGLNRVEAQTSAIPFEHYGVWDRGSEASDFDPSTKEYDYIRGIALSVKWSDIQTKVGDVNFYDWSTIQDALDMAEQKVLPITIKINVGPHSPDWFYTDLGEDNVQPVYTTHFNAQYQKYPLYTSPQYKTLYHNLIREFADFIWDHPAKNRVSFIFPQTGSSGDEVPYQGELEETSQQFIIEDDDWWKFRQESFLVWKQHFRERDGERKMPFLFNNIEPKSTEFDWVTNEETIGLDIGLKNGMGYCRGTHLRNERVWVESHKEYLVNPQGVALFNRAEMDLSYIRPLYLINQDMNFYWSAIGGLNAGQSIWDVSKGALELARENEWLQDSFRFFTKYAGQIVPADSTKAFIALHEGLDASDTEKFTLADYPGDPTLQDQSWKLRKNVLRYKQIVNSYADRGAKIDDESALLMGQVNQRRLQEGFNSIGWEIWPTNFSRFITQVDPDEESIGLWRVGVGSKVNGKYDGVFDGTEAKESRFARSFENSTGRNQMNFKMETGFFPEDAGVVKFTVIYLDKNKDSTWELQYDAGDGNFKTADTVVCDGTNQWQTLEVTVTDAVMQNNGPEGADFALVNTDMDDTLTEDEDDGSLDDIFHMIEIEQLPRVPFLLGDGNQDGAVNFLDIAPFLARLASGAHQEEVDINGDNLVNFLDIAPFVAILGAG